MSNFLILSKRLSFDGENPWLTDDLVLSLIDRNQGVDVLLFDLSGRWEKGKSDWRGANVYAFPVKSRKGFRRLFSIILTYIRVLFFSLFLARRNKYDAVVGFSISSFFLFVPTVMRCFSSSLNILFLWDFFPFHHQEIGKVNGKVSFFAAKILEKISIYEYDQVALMSKKNRDVFLDLYKGYLGQVSVVPLWGREQASFGKKKELVLLGSGLNVVFGGQLTYGRGVEDIVVLARRLCVEGSDVEIHVFGDGDLSFLIKEEAENNPHLCYWGSVGREEYKGYLRLADVGLVVTVSDVTYPTFPSKVIDYFSCRKPVIASVEKGTDFGTFVRDEAGAGISVTAGDANGLYDAVIECLSLKKAGKLSDMGDRGYEYYLSYMEVSNTVLWLKELVRRRG